MSQNLFALCRSSKKSELSIYRIPLDANTQSDIATLFEEQNAAFLKNIDEEILYNGMWKPDGNQVLIIKTADCSEANELQKAVQNPKNPDDLDIKNFAKLGIKALFAGHVSDGKKVFIQQFTEKQILKHRRVFVAKNNQFNRLTESAFSLDDKLSAIIDGDKIKFKSFHILRSILDIGHLFKAATEEETKNFIKNPIFSCSSIDIFLTQADEPIRKKIALIVKDKILDIPIEDIKIAAKEVNFLIKIEGDKLIMPMEKQEIKKLLSFLNSDIYNAPITKDSYITNSKRKFSN